MTRPASHAGGYLPVETRMSRSGRPLSFAGRKIRRSSPESFGIRKEDAAR